jgi:hypothetical protein
MKFFASLLMLPGLLATAQAADIKPGLWEFRSKLDMPGMPDMAAQMAEMQAQMKNLPPEARRMMEQQMAAQGVSMGSGGSIRVCITPEDAKGAKVYSGKSEGDCNTPTWSTPATGSRAPSSAPSPGPAAISKR